MRPENTPDPRDPLAPIRVDDVEEDRARSYITIGELFRALEDETDTTIYERFIAPEISEEEWEDLRERRDEILTALRRLRRGGE
jgi:hypothetical protein